VLSSSGEIKQIAASFFASFYFLYYRVAVPRRKATNKLEARWLTPSLRFSFGFPLMCVEKKFIYTFMNIYFMLP
jgi:hypothetical protein